MKEISKKPQQITKHKPHNPAILYWDTWRKHGDMEKTARVSQQMKKQTIKEFLVLIQMYLEFRLLLIELIPGVFTFAYTYFVVLKWEENL